MKDHHGTHKKRNPVNVWVTEDDCCARSTTSADDSHSNSSTFCICDSKKDCCVFTNTMTTTTITERMKRRSCIKGSRPSNAAATATSCNKKKVHFGTGKFKFNHNNNNPVQQIHAVKCYAVQPYKDKLYWSPKEILGMIQNPHYASSNKEEEATSTRAHLYMETIYQTRKQLELIQQKPLLSKEDYSVLVMGRKAGFAGVERYHDEWKLRYHQGRVHYITQSIIQAYQQRHHAEQYAVQAFLQNKTTVNVVDWNVKIRSLYRSLTISDRYWAKVIGLADWEIAMSIYEKDKQTIPRYATTTTIMMTTTTTATKSMWESSCSDLSSSNEESINNPPSSSLHEQQHLLQSPLSSLIGPRKTTFPSSPSTSSSPRRHFIPASFLSLSPTKSLKLPLKISSNSKTNNNHDNSSYNKSSRTKISLFQNKNHKLQFGKCSDLMNHDNDVDEDEGDDTTTSYFDETACFFDMEDHDDD